MISYRVPKQRSAFVSFANLLVNFWGHIGYGLRPIFFILLCFAISVMGKSVIARNNIKEVDE